MSDQHSAQRGRGRPFRSRIPTWVRLKSAPGDGAGKSLRPAFIVGCGRSGTTVLGTTLGRHSDILYLNEPRRLWAAIDRRTDIWSWRARRRGGRIVLTAEDVTDTQREKARGAFERLRDTAGREVVLEKLPINAFRLGFINAIFPEARFIYIVRNGFDVARSIARLSEAGKWFGRRSYKWELLRQLAEHRPQDRDALALCKDEFDKGLLEWRLSNQAVVEFLRRMDRERFLELSYAELTKDPAGTVWQLLVFLGLDVQDAVTDFAARELDGGTREDAEGSPDQRAWLLGGALLPRAVRGDRLAVP